MCSSSRRRRSTKPRAGWPRINHGSIGRCGLPRSTRAGNEHWLRTLLGKLLEGSPDVVGLLDSNPFGDRAPRYARLAIYRYEFATPDQGNASGAWWRRELMGYLTESITRPGP